MGFFFPLCGVIRDQVKPNNQHEAAEGAEAEKRRGVLFTLLPLLSPVLDFLSEKQVVMSL
jgi:hypothetical protein